MTSGLAALLLALGVSGFTVRDQDVATVDARVDGSEITVGGRVAVTIVVEHDSAAVVQWPEHTDSLGAFEVLRMEVGDPTTTTGRTRSVATLTVTAFELGDLELPSIEIGLREAGAAAPAVLRTDPLTITVTSVGRDEAGDIRDIRPPLDIPRNWLLLVPWIVALAAAVAAGWWLHRRIRRRETSEAVAEATAATFRPPHQVALEALEELERSGLLDRGEVKAHFIAVSEIVRTYVHGRYGIDAMDMTTRDVMDNLRRTGVASETFDRFDTFLTRSDLVKFAKHQPIPSACREMIPMARDLVERTTEWVTAPAPEPIDPSPVEVAEVG